MLLFLFIQLICAETNSYSCGLYCDYSIDSTTMSINVDGIISEETQWNINQLKRITTLKLKGNLTDIPANFIEKFTSLKTVELHIENVIDGLFENTQIENVVIGKEVKEIKERVFENCNKLSSVQFENNSVLKTIGDYAFNNCT